MKEERLLHHVLRAMMLVNLFILIYYVLVAVSVVELDSAIPESEINTCLPVCSVLRLQVRVVESLIRSIGRASAWKWVCYWSETIETTTIVWC